jgi:hypothetical protein
MEYFAHWFSDATLFTMLLLAYGAGLYLLLLLIIFGVHVRQSRVLELGLQLQLIAAGCVVYLLTCATWCWGLH